MNRKLTEPSAEEALAWLWEAIAAPAGLRALGIQAALETYGEAVRRDERRLLEAERAT